ncbi:MAG: hypothetical protein OXG44_20245 [Gammaproteobacteria bacterium]|nr:hypothetical protein [Gammaproteobacteria bacterium]
MEIPNGEVPKDEITSLIEGCLAPMATSISLAIAAALVVVAITRWARQLGQHET